MEPIVALGFVVLIIACWLITIWIIGRMSGEDIPNKICKELAGKFDPAILTMFNLRPSHFICDIIMPAI